MVGSAGHFKQSLRQMAVAVGVLLQVVLMVLVGKLEHPQRLHFDRQRAAVAVLNLTVDVHYRWIILIVNVVDACTIASALVLTLTVLRRRVDTQEIEFQQLGQWQHVRVILHAHCLGVAGAVGVDLLVGRLGILVHVAVGEPRGGTCHAVNLAQVVLCAPEASSCQIYRFSHALITSYVVVYCAVQYFVDENAHNPLGFKC